MNELIPYIPAQLKDITNSLHYFMPELCLGILFVLVFIADLIAGKSNAVVCRAVALAGVILVTFETYVQLNNFTGEPRFLFGGMLLLHHVTILFKLVIDVVALLLLLYLPWDKALRSHYKGLADLYSIIIASLLGLHLMTMASNLLSIYISVEMVSIASYMMAAYRSDTAVSTEAGMKYVLFGATSSAIMLYGISLLYGFAGTMDMFGTDFVRNLMLAYPISVSFAIVMVMAGLGFKLSFVPMHFWVPDVYQGAATPVTAYLSTLPKIAGFALLINFLRPFVFNAYWSTFDFRLFLSVIGIVTMIAGNLAAIWQTNIKRLLAYSSIGHTGFVLMAVVAFTGNDVSFLIFYLVAYAVANVAALMLATYYVNKIGAATLDGYKGVGLRYPLPSICFVIILVSLAGLPITAGFNGKVFVFSAAYNIYQQNHNGWLLALMITGAATTVVALFYYIKIPLYMFLKKNDHHADDLIVNHRYLLVMVVFLTAFLLLTGIFPQFLSNIFN